MIKIFRKLRWSSLESILSSAEGRKRIPKYIAYAAGEIILVVIGILIALQLNTQKEDRQQRDLGYKYLTEMRTEVENDLLNLDIRIRRLERNLQNHEAALSTKNMATLPLDSVAMILRTENLDFKISELTFTRMKNLGLTSLTNNDALNTQISTYYNYWVVYLKLSMDYVFQELRKYLDYMAYQQDAVDLNFLVFSDNTVEFPALYPGSLEDFENEARIKSIEFITSTRGRMLVLMDLSNKRYSLRVLKRFKTRTQDLLESIYKELKSNNPQIEPLPQLPTEADFKEIKLAPKVLKEYVGTYRSKDNREVTVFEGASHLIFTIDDGSDVAMIPSAIDAFFLKDNFFVVGFNRKKDQVISLNTNYNGQKSEFMKVEY
jgi:hypothetical protein